MRPLSLSRILCCASGILSFPLLVSANAGPGDAAPPVTIEALSNAPEGTKATWDAMKNQTVVLEFWGTWCGPCVAAIPHFNELQTTFKDKNVVFLAVTYEKPELIHAFLKRQPMNAWIGHDTDKSMVKAYGITAWPTTIVVHKGKIVARLYPSELTKKRLQSYVDGHVDLRSEGSFRSQIEVPVGPDGRPLINMIHPGVDPFCLIEDPAILQVMVRKAADAEGQASSMGNLTGLGMSVRESVAQVWGVPSYAVSGEKWLDEELYDLVWQVPVTTSAQGREAARQLIAEAMGIQVFPGLVHVKGFSAKSSGKEVTLPDAIHDTSNWVCRMRNDELQITGTSMSVSVLLDILSDNLNCAIWDDVEPGGSYFVDLTIPTGKDAATAFFNKTGIKLVEEERSIEGLRVEKKKK